MDDHQVLLQEIRRMDAAALAKVFDLYASAIYKYALRHCCNAITADQIVGDVFGRLLEQLSAGSGPGSNLRLYLFQIAHHLLVDQARYARRMAPIGALEWTLPAAGRTDLTVEQRMLLESVWQAIRSGLTESQQHVIILRYIEGFSLKETALILGKKVGNIKVTQNRAVAALRKALDDRQMDPELLELSAGSRQTL